MNQEVKGLVPRQFIQSVNQLKTIADSNDNLEITITTMMTMKLKLPNNPKLKIVKIF